MTLLFATPFSPFSIVKMAETTSLCSDFLDARCSDLHLEQIAEHIVDWEELAPYFNITQAEQQVIKANHVHQYKLQKREMLWKWMEKSGNGATYRRMKEIFSTAKKAILADKIEDILHEPYSQSPLSAVAAFKLYLKDCYSSISTTSVGEQDWPPLMNASFVDPELHVVQGQLMMKMRKKILIADLFQDAKSRKILLEGTAGSGKTTLTRKICQQWAQGNFLHHVDLLIHLTLADPKLWSAKSLKDMIPHPSADVCKAVADHIVDKRGKGCCFVMDGWEDLPEEMQKSSFIRRVLHSQQPQLALPRCVFLVTCRPIASASLKQLVTTTVEISGFSAESVDVYATQYLTQQGRDPTVFITALNDNHYARGLSSLPINAAILLHLFMTIQTGFPATQTELFRCFLLNVLLHHLVAKKKHYLNRLTSFSHLPEKEKRSFEQLCCIAYYATLQGKSTSQSNQLLSSDELQKAGLQNLQDTLGLMKVHQQLTWCGYDPHYGFLHSSVQDFLCAVRMSQLSPEEQTKDFKFIMSNNPMSLVLLFYSGITNLDNSRVCERLRQMGEKPPDEMTIVPNLCDTKSEARDSRRLYLAYLHCLYEASRNDLLAKSNAPGPASIAFIWYRLSVYDINVVFYFVLDIVQLYYPTRVAFCFGKCSITDHGIESAVAVLINHANMVHWSTQNRHMSFDLALYANELTHHGVGSLMTLISTGNINLSFLDISRNLITQKSSGFVALKTLIETLSPNKIDKLRLYCCGFTSRHAYHLILLIGQVKEYLNISENPLRECVPFLVLATGQLQMMDLRGTQILSQNLLEVGRMLQSNTCLKLLSIGYRLFDEDAPTSDITPEIVCKFIELITATNSRSVLSTLSIADCYMKAVRSRRVQDALLMFALRRFCHPLNVVPFSVAHNSFAVGRGFREQIFTSSVPDSLLFGNI